MQLVRWALSSPAYMWLRTTLGVGFSGMVMVACGGGGGAPSTYQDPAIEQNPTEPAAEANGSSGATEQPPAQEEEPGSTETSIASASPACAPVGSRVVLKLGMTRDNRSVDCYDVDRVQVVFAPNKQAKVTVMGPMSDGFCAIDTEVPKGAESGTIRIEIGKDSFVTESAFPVPCPGS